MSGSTQSGEPTSKYFVAHLGEATAEVAARLLQWAAGCVAHSLLRDELNHVSLYFERARGENRAPNAEPVAHAVSQVEAAPGAARQALAAGPGVR